MLKIIHSNGVKMKNRIIMILAVLLFLVFVAGCSKLTRENYDAVKVGMDYQEVTQLLGEPDKCDGALGGKNCIWGNEEKNITIKFVADKVALPSMKGL